MHGQQRFEEEALAFKRAQRQLRRKRLDDDEDSNNITASATYVHDGSTSSSAPNGNSDAAKATADPSSPHHEKRDDGEPSSETSTSADAPTHRPLSPPAKAEAKLLDAQTPTPAATPAAQATDPVALAKIVNFCEELKRQNEDVKQQLMAQHSVLASLQSTLIDTTAPAAASSVSASLKAGAKASVAPTASMKKSTSASARSVQTRQQVKTTTPMTVAAPAHERMSTSGTDTKAVVERAAPRAPVVRARPSRGESKIPYPPHAAPASVVSSASAVAESKHMRHTSDCKAPANDEEKSVVHCRESPANATSAFESPARDDAMEQEDATAVSAQTKASAASAVETKKDCDGDRKDDNDDDDVAPEQLVQQASKRSVDREHKTEGADWDVQHKTADDDDDETEIVCTDAYVAIEPDDAVDGKEDELPLGSESQLLLQSDVYTSAKESDDNVEIASCSSFQLVTSASALVALDRPLTELFQ